MRYNKCTQEMMEQGMVSKDHNKSVEEGGYRMS